MIIDALTWQLATITEIRQESPRTKTFVLETSGSYTFTAGQHLIARVTFDDGFKTSRGYSMSSAPSSGTLEITIAKADHGEVSGWFCDTATVGRIVEITQPIGVEFLWTPNAQKTTLFIAGGIGVAPFMSMLRENTLQQNKADLRLLYSAKNYEDICFKDELLDPANADTFNFILSRTVPENWKGIQGRITTEILAPLITDIDNIYICGPYLFVGAIKKMLIESLHFPTTNIHVEKFN